MASEKGQRTCYYYTMTIPPRDIFEKVPVTSKVVPLVHTKTGHYIIFGIFSAECGLLKGAKKAVSETVRSKKECFCNLVGRNPGRRIVETSNGTDAAHASLKTAFLERRNVSSAEPERQYVLGTARAHPSFDRYRQIARSPAIFSIPRKQPASKYDVGERFTSEEACPHAATTQQQQQQ